MYFLVVDQSKGEQKGHFWGAVGVLRLINDVGGIRYGWTLAAPGRLSISEENTCCAGFRIQRATAQRQSKSFFVPTWAPRVSASTCEPNTPFTFFAATVGIDFGVLLFWEAGTFRHQTWASAAFKQEISIPPRKRDNCAGCGRTGRCADRHPVCEN